MLIIASKVLRRPASFGCCVQTHDMGSAGLFSHRAKEPHISERIPTSSECLFLSEFFLKRMTSLAKWTKCDLPCSEDMPQRSWTAMTMRTVHVHQTKPLFANKGPGTAINKAHSTEMAVRVDLHPGQAGGVLIVTGTLASVQYMPCRAKGTWRRPDVA